MCLSAGPALKWTLTQRKRDKYINMLLLEHFFSLNISINPFLCQRFILAITDVHDAHVHVHQRPTESSIRSPSIYK